MKLIYGTALMISALLMTLYTTDTPLVDCSLRDVANDVFLPMYAPRESAILTSSLGSKRIPLCLTEDCESSSSSSNFTADPLSSLSLSLNLIKSHSTMSFFNCKIRSFSARVSKKLSTVKKSCAGFHAVFVLIVITLVYARALRFVKQELKMINEDALLSRKMSNEHSNASDNIRTPTSNKTLY
eukprot:Nk52_evm11s248 gene=Nk52_evmTU11s248